MNPIIPIIDATIDPKFEFLPFFFNTIIMPKAIAVIPEIRIRMPVMYEKYTGSLLGRVGIERGRTPQTIQKHLMTRSTMVL
jgi:hypothetical protein